MNKQRKVVITTTYNEMGIIIDTKAEEVVQPEVIRCKNCKYRYLDGMIWNCPFGLSGGEDFFCAYGAIGGGSGT